jgi:hypothetical protein
VFAVVVKVLFCARRNMSFVPFSPYIRHILPMPLSWHAMAVHREAFFFVAALSCVFACLCHLVKLDTQLIHVSSVRLWLPCSRVVCRTCQSWLNHTSFKHPSLLATDASYPLTGLHVAARRAAVRSWQAPADAQAITGKTNARSDCSTQAQRQDEALPGQPEQQWLRLASTRPFHIAMSDSSPHVDITRAHPLAITDRAA